MPSSYYGFLVDVLDELLDVRPRSVLDVGVGFGKMGMLFREYCDVFCAAGYGPKHWKTQIDGIEIHEPYILEHQRAIYDTILIGNALDLLPTLPRYDFIYAGDVLEHVDRRAGWELLRWLRKKAGRLVLAVPLGPRWEQGETFGNPHEAHLAMWTPDDFADATRSRLAEFRGKPLGLFVF